MIQEILQSQDENAMKIAMLEEIMNIAKDN